MENEKTVHIVPHSLYGLILIVLICLTGLSLAVTRIELASLTVFVALFIAGIKGTLVLTYFMHLKFDNLLLKIMVAATFFLLSFSFPGQIGCIHLLAAAVL